MSCVMYEPTVAFVNVVGSSLAIVARHACCAQCVRQETGRAIPDERTAQAICLASD